MTTCIDIQSPQKAASTEVFPSPKFEDAKSSAPTLLTLPCHMLNKTGELGHYELVFTDAEAQVKSYHSSKVKATISLKNLVPHALLKEEMVSESLTTSGDS